MHRHLHSPTKLTEFARDFDAEEPDTLFGKLVNRLTNAYNTSYNTVNVAPAAAHIVPVLHAPRAQRFIANNATAAAITTSTSSITTTVSPDEQSNSSSSSSAPTPPPPRAAVDRSESTSLASGRSVTTTKSSTPSGDDDEDAGLPPNRLQPSVISRIGNLMAMRNSDSSLTSYKDTELQRFWMPDAKSKECYECSLKFTTFRRKHHCRLCGQIFCAKCCNQVVPGKIINCSGDLKVCRYCSNIVLSYLKSADINSDLRSDLQALQDDLATKLSVGNSCTASGVCVGGGGAHSSVAGSIGAGGSGGGGSAGSRNDCGIRGGSDRFAGGNGDDQQSNNADASSLGASSLLAQRKVSVGYQEERLVLVQPKSSSTVSSSDRKQILRQSQSLKALHEQMAKALPHQQKRTGAELVRYVLANTQLAATEPQAITILSAMLEAGFLVPLPATLPLATMQPTVFGTSSDDDDLAVLVEFSVQRAYRLLRPDDVMTASGSSFQLDVDVDASWVHMTRPLLAATQQRHVTADAAAPCEDADELGLVGQDVSFNFSASKDVEMQNSVLSTAGSKPLMEAFCGHEELLLNQLLAAESIPDAWAKILLQLCAEIVNAFSPGQCGMMVLESPRRSMDIRHFVNFKKVPGGQRHESRICGGIGFTKNVVHKEMAALIEKPRVLLLKCAIVYQRVEGRFVSIDTLLLQETEYLRNVTARILQLRPSVVLVHRNVAGIAQDMLRAHGITLVLDVKLSVLERLARALQCDILEAIDSNVGRPKLGTCDRFRTRTFENGATGARKTLMFFEQQSLQRGCCVLLRGGEAELVRVKRVARMLLYARYNWRLELALLLDEFARPPSPKASIFDSKDHSPVKEEEGATGGETDGKPGVQPEEIIHSKPTADRIKSENRSAEQPTAIEPNNKLVTKENVQDFSDPLRAVDLSPSAFDQESSVEFAVETPFDNHFRTALSSTVLSVSPFTAFPLPYLETESGRKCTLRRRFPQEMYYSRQWSGRGAEKVSGPGDCSTAHDASDLQTSRPPNAVQFGDTHEFLSHKITTSIANRDLQAMWASYRASGSRLTAKRTMRKIPDTASSSTAAAADTTPTDVAVPSGRQQQPRVDALSIDNHQRLPVLFCSFYSSPKTTSTFCAPPSLLRMTFYGEQDIMLGQFLEHYCFRRSYMCPSCQLPMLSHVRRFVHSLGCVQLILAEDQSPHNSEHILMMSWCSICHAWTPYVPISVDTWCLSFAKYLEHRFHSHAYRRRTVDPTASERSDTDTRAAELAAVDQCTHSMHRDHVHYFSFNGVVASFAYSPIACWSIGMPATVRTLAARRTPTPSALEEIKHFGQAGYEVFARIHERLATIATDCAELPMLAGLKQALNRDQLEFRDRINLVQTLLTDGGGVASVAGVWDVPDAMFGVKRTLAENIDQWTVRLNEAIAAASAAAVAASTNAGGGGGGSSGSQQRTLHQQRSGSGRPDSSGSIDAGTICTEDLRMDSPDRSTTRMNSSGSGGIGDTTSTAEAAPAQRRTSEHSTEPPNESSSQSPTRLPSDSSAPAKDPSDKKSVKTLLRELLPSDKPAACCIPSPLPAGEHYYLSTGGKFPVTVHDQDVSSVIAFSLVSHDFKRALNARLLEATASAAAAAAQTDAALSAQATATTTTSNMPSSAGAGGSASPSLIGPRKSSDGPLDGDAEQREPSEKKRLSSAAAHIEVNFSDSTTMFTCKSYFAREFDTLRASLIETSQRQSTNASPNKDAFTATPDSKDSSNATSGGSSSGGAASAHTLTVPSADDVDEVRGMFARSLCHSVQWEARGGKSGSKFCKTKDDRFVLKEMSKVDVNIFENFAPKYFEYIAQCLQGDEPTLLAKIFGVYRVTIKKKDYLLEKSLLVMENLFYNSDIDSKYDLKGSDRNRLVNPDETGAEKVLLDQNLIQKSWSQPLYIHGHSQAILLSALVRDTTFLERNGVMDYSLLVGLNGKDKTLVLGIIDYIRTFTFDKRIESMLKKSGILGGQGKLPTVISPKQYKQRFIEAMERYFPVVPDRWEGLGQCL